MFAKDFVGYYLLSESFSHYNSYAFVNVVGYGTTQTGLQARAPLLPILLEFSKFAFGNSLLGVYIPILVCRLLVTPLTFLVASFFLPFPIAFLASSLTVLIPKLQTFSLSALEADSFVLVFYLFAIYFYLHFRKTKRNINLFLTGLSLGLLTLVKEVGFPISAGFIFSVVVERYLHKHYLNTKNLLYLSVPFILLTLPFFVFSLAKSGTLYFSAVTLDRNLRYLPENLPVLIQSVPYYLLGIDNVNLLNETVKSLFVNSLILILFLAGSVHFLIKKNFVLIMPTFFTFLALGILNAQSIGGNLPWNFELITILAFTMPIAAIFVFKGLTISVDYFIQKFNFPVKYKNIIYLFFSIIIIMKFMNNFLSRPYTQDFSGDYYISIKTVLTDARALPKFTFERNNEGNLVVKDLSPVIVHMRNEYRLEKIDVFSANFKLIITILVYLGIGCAFLSYVTNKKKLR